MNNKRIQSYVDKMESTVNQMDDTHPEFYAYRLFLDNLRDIIVPEVELLEETIEIEKEVAIHLAKPYQRLRAYIEEHQIPCRVDQHMIDALLQHCDKLESDCEDESLAKMGVQLEIRNHLKDQSGK